MIRTDGRPTIAWAPKIPLDLPDPTPPGFQPPPPRPPVIRGGSGRIGVHRAHSSRWP